MRAALQALAQDAETRVIVLLSKPPDAIVATRLVEAASQSGKPCILALLGNPPGTITGRPIYQAPTLDAAAAMAGALVRGEPVSLEAGVPPHLASSLQAARTILQPGQQGVRGLYCGGTLAYEALWLLREALGDVASNLDGTWQPASDTAHAVLDLGAEEYTSGRPHPMIDPTVRCQQLLEIARQPAVAVVLCDVILGWGAHADPATALVEAWEEAQALAGSAGRRLVGIATVCGTPSDPQGYARQCQVLRDHGWWLADSNAQAVRLAGAVVRPPGTDTPLQRSTAPLQAMPAVPRSVQPAPEVPARLSALLATGPQVINIGLELFTTQLLACGVPVVHVDWRPPAGGDTQLLGVLERLQ
jgi:FdrA protein